MEKTKDPTRDADRYNSDMEERPIKHYVGRVTMTICFDCYGCNLTEAESYLKEKVEDVVYLLRHSQLDDFDTVDIDGTNINEG